MSMFNGSECQLFDFTWLDYKSATTGNPVLNLEIVQYNLKVHYSMACDERTYVQKLAVCSILVNTSKCMLSGYVY